MHFRRRHDVAGEQQLRRAVPADLLRQVHKMLDYFGYPHSDEMRLEERYRRTSYDTLELNMTVTDPKYYAKPWKSQTKRFKLLPKDFIKTPEGWSGLLEDVCVPSDEAEFNRVIRDPAGTGKPAAAPPARR